MSNGIENAVHKGVKVTKKTAQKGIDTAKHKIQNQAQKRYVKQVENNMRSTTNKSIRTSEQTKKTVKQTASSAGNKTIKTFQKGAVKTAKGSIKTAEKIGP